MNKSSSAEEFRIAMDMRLEELSDIHDSRTETPEEAFAKKIAGPVAHQVISKAHDAEPELHPDREW